MSLFYLNQECFFRIVEKSIVISNPYLRIHVEIDAKAATILLQNITGLSRIDWIKQFNGSIGVDRTERFMGVNGLVTDHSGFQKKVAQESITVEGDKLFKLLRDRLILIENSSESRLRVSPLKNLLDHEHLGSFHQRVGQYVLLGLESAKFGVLGKIKNFLKMASA